MYDMMKKQNFGVEIELTGNTRERAAQVIATYFGTSSRYAGTYYKTYTATDRKGRTWKAMSDGSIRTEMKNGSRAEHDYSSCGIHVHVDGKKHNAESLTRLINFATGRQDLFYEALEIGARADRWCHKMNKTLLNAMKASGTSRESIEQIWYSSVNDGYTGGINHDHYNTTRYHGINLHALFTKGTVEFRLFNGTTHAGKIKAYVQFCLAMSAWALASRDTKLYFKNCASYTPAQKETLMMGVLSKRLDLSGPEFKTCRLHLTAAFRAAATSEVA